MHEFVYMIEVSVVVPTYNRLDRLQRVLSCLEGQTYPRDRYEVIVVSDGSTDGTAEYLRALTQDMHLKYVQQENQGPAAARNQGMRMAAGAIVLFLDDDVIPAPNLIAEHMRSHQQSANSVVIGPMLTPEDFQLSPWVSWEQAKLNDYYSKMLSGQYSASSHLFYTGNASLARSVLIASGGFDKSFRRAEDIELANRLEGLGVRFVFNERAVGYHYAERSFRSWMETPYQYGKNNIIFALQKKQAGQLDDVFRDFLSRNLLIRLLVTACLDRPVLGKLIIWGLKWTLVLSDRLKVKAVSLAACSGIFNLRYFQGASDQLNGKKEFFSKLNDLQRRQAHARAV